MAAYGTPQYEYTKGTSDLALNKGLSDATNDYGRYISQQRFRREQDQIGTQFKKGFPGVGQRFSNRGLWNSGLRRQGQREYAGEFQRALHDSQFEQGAMDQNFQMQRTGSDAQYQAALLDLYERLQAARANVDPFAGVYIPE